MARASQLELMECLAQMLPLVAAATSSTPAPSLG